jgi:hypothetical protein
LAISYLFASIQQRRISCGHTERSLPEFVLFAADAREIGTDEAATLMALFSKPTPASRTATIGDGGFMKWMAELLIVLPSAPSCAQQCSRGQMPRPSGCVQVCQRGYKIAKENGSDTCVREGNFTIKVHRSRYAFLPIAAGNDVDGICFGIREDEDTIDSVVDDRFIDPSWHAPHSHIWIAEMSYALDPALIKLRLTALRSWRVDQNKKPVGVSDPIPQSAEVPLCEAPQRNWPCTEKQWSSIRTAPKVTAVPPGYSNGAGVSNSTRSPSGRCSYFQREVWGPYAFVT